MPAGPKKSSISNYYFEKLNVPQQNIVQILSIYLVVVNCCIERVFVFLFALKIMLNLKINVIDGLWRAVEQETILWC